MSVARLAAAMGMTAALLAGAVLPASARDLDPVIYGGPTTHPTIALTFDDGYAPERCLEIASILDEHGIQATWFPNGINVRRAPDIWRRIARRHPIANHTLTHASLVGLRPKRIKDELLTNERAIERVTGRPMLPILRPTFGAYDDKVVRTAQQLGYRVVMWSLSAADTSPKGTDRGIAQRALRGGPGAIILMHCGPEVTPRILPVVIARYACAGYRFAALDDLLAGSPGVAARVSCPPPRLPPAPHRRPDRDRPDADPGTEVDATASAEPGSPSPTPDPSAVAAEDGRPGVISYDLGDVTISQTEVADPALARMPVAMRGLLAVPAGDGPAPVAVIVHGAYAFCAAPLGADQAEPYPCPAEHDLRQYEGFGDLASRLAARGYLTLVPDLSAEYTSGFGAAGSGERAVQILDAHLDALADGSAFPVDVAGRADLDRLVLAGHADGGPLVVRYATDERAGHAPRAVALLTPTSPAAEAFVPEALPTALLVSGCDGDVGATETLAWLTRLPASRTAPTLVRTLPGGTHNAFSTRLPADPRADCADVVALDPAAQRAISATLLTSFFDLATAVPPG